MSTITEQLDRMAVSALSQDKRIRADLRDRTKIRFAFQAGSYEAYTNSALEEQLQSVIERVWRGRRNGLHKVFFTSEKASWDAQRRRYYDEIGSTRFIGGSMARGIVIASIGMKSFRVKLSNDTRCFNEETFVRELEHAFRLIQIDSRSKIAELKRKYFDIEVPEGIRIVNPTRKMD